MTNLKIPPKELILDENLAYILGVIEGDGCIYKYEVVLGVKDKDFALAFKKALEEWSGIKVGFYTYKKQVAPYKVILNSKCVAFFLKDFDINKIKISSKKNKEMFLKGVYDSEGCVGFYKYKSIQREIYLGNNNKQLLQLCIDLLLDLDIESSKIKICIKKGSLINFPIQKNYITKVDYYELVISRKENLIKFRDSVGFNIKRKQNKLADMIKSYFSEEQIKFKNSLPSQERKNWRKIYK